MSRPPRTEREAIRRSMNSYSMGGRYGDWLSVLVMDRPKSAAKVYWLMAQDSDRQGFPEDAQGFRSAAKELWPEIVDWNPQTRLD